MKKSLVKKYLIILALVLVVALALAGCDQQQEGDPVDKTALNAEIALEITSKGDYTDESYNDYTQKLATAKQLASDETATQNAVNQATLDLTNARLALTIRPVELVAGANKQLKLNSGESKQIAIADYINTNNLSNITYNVMASNPAITLSQVVDGSFTITAGEVQGELDAKVSINVYYNNVAKRSAELSVKVINEVAPTVTEQEFVKVYDMLTLGNVDSLTIDFAENVNNLGKMDLTYSAKLDDEDLVLDGTLYTVELDTYTSETTYKTFTVTISCTVNGKPTTVEYTYKLGLKDSTSLSMANGGFENGLDGWTVVGNIGSVSGDTHYWLNDPESAEGFAFGMDGAKMFSAYAPGAQETAVGTLTSPTFTLSGSGFVTFKLGAMKDGNYVYVDVVDANTKQILARYYNGLWADRTNGAKSGCTLVAYKADLSEYRGKELFFRISDNADSGYGLFFADSFITYYESEPDGFNDATPVNYTVSGTIYDLFNGGFELGDVQGWWNIGEIGVVTNATGYWADNISYGKHGEYLFTGVESFGADTMRESHKGTLTSSAFELGGTGYISFMLGGGGNELCYVQVIDSTTGEVLAKYHQQAQQDAKLIQYVADLSAYRGRTVRIQVVDQAENGWGCVSFDNVVTYYATTDSLPQGAITANDIKDADKYKIKNGSFETGDTDGWTMEITETGDHSTLGWVLETEIDADWYTKNNDRKDGKYLFTFVQPGDVNCEGSTGTLTSSTFTLKQNSYVSFRFGGAGTHDVYIQLVKADGTVVSTFYNDAEGKVNTEMYAYYYQYTGETADCFFRIVDNSTRNYGCFVVDDFRVNLDTAPEGFIEAIE